MKYQSLELAVTELRDSVESLSSVIDDVTQRIQESPPPATSQDDLIELGKMIAARAHLQAAWGLLDELKRL